MKSTVVAVALVAGFLLFFFRPAGYAFVVGFPVVFLVYGIIRSTRGKLNPINDVPNALRVVLACAASFCLVVGSGFLLYSASIIFFATSLFLNDEYQRRTMDSLSKGRKGGAVALLGIDGSGKSTHAAALEEWFRLRGYYCTRVPFHRYLLVDRFSSSRKSSRGLRGRRGGGNPLRPVISVADNLVLYLQSSFGKGIEGRVVIYDRFIWSTYVKYVALGYPVRPIRWLYMLPHPRYAVVLDIPVTKSLKVIESRPNHIRYEENVLSEERREYLSIAKEKGFAVVNATRDFESVQQEIEALLGKVFPAVTGVRSR
jgi:dTMP kinase